MSKKQKRWSKQAKLAILRQGSQEGVLVTVLAILEWTVS